MLKFLATHLSEFGFKSVGLEVYAFNTKALSAYIKFGFETITQVEDKIQMRKKQYYKTEKITKTDCGL